MSILIKGMKMPKSCESCPCKTAEAFGGLGCQATGYIPLREANQDRPDNCPLISVPPHGRLIDADSKTFPTFHRNPSNDYMKGWNACLKSVQQQPTIIPAEEED